MTIEQKADAKRTTQTSKVAKGPEHVFREGSVAAMIWKRESATGFPYYEYSITRSWKSQASGKTGYSQNYFAKNESQLLKVIGLASGWITAAEAKDHADTPERCAA